MNFQTAIAGLAIAPAAFVTLTAAPAQACDMSLCGEIRHYSPDDGYDDPIKVKCNDNVIRYIPEGVHSFNVCKDVEIVYVRTNEEIWCRFFRVYGPGTTVVSWEKVFDAEGPHPIGNRFNDGSGCTVRRD